MTVLVDLAFKSKEGKDTPSTQEALKCISNCIQLNEDVKAYLEEQDVIGSCQKLLQSDDRIGLDAQFLTCRILFFLTVNRPDLVTKLIDSHISDAIEKVSNNENHLFLAKVTNMRPINRYCLKIFQFWRTQL